MPGMIPTPLAMDLIQELDVGAAQEKLEERVPAALTVQMVTTPPVPTGAPLPPTDTPPPVVELDDAAGRARVILSLVEPIAARLGPHAIAYLIRDHADDWTRFANMLGRAPTLEEIGTLETAVRGCVAAERGDPMGTLADSLAHELVAVLRKSGEAPTDQEISTAAQQRFREVVGRGATLREVLQLDAAVRARLSAEPEAGPPTLRPEEIAAEDAPDERGAVDAGRDREEQPPVFVFCCDVPGCPARTEDDEIPFGWSQVSFASNEFTVRLGKADWINLHFCPTHTHLSTLPKTGRTWREQIADLRDAIDNPASKESLGLIPIASSKPLLGQVIRHFREREMEWPRLLLVMLGDILDVAQKQANSMDHITALLAANGIGPARITADVRRAAFILARKGHDAESIVAELLKISEMKLRALLDAELSEAPAERYIFREKPGSYLITGAMAEESPPPAEPTGDDDAPDPLDQSGELFFQRYRHLSAKVEVGAKGALVYERFRQLYDGAPEQLPDFDDLPWRIARTWDALGGEILAALHALEDETPSGRRSDLQLAQAEVNELSSKLAAAEHEIAELKKSTNASPSAETIAAVLRLGIQIAPGETSPFVKGLVGKSISEAIGLLIEAVRADGDFRNQVERGVAKLASILPGGAKLSPAEVLDKALGEIVDGDDLLRSFDDLLWRASRRWLPGTLLDEALNLHDRYVAFLGGPKVGIPKVIATRYGADADRRERPAVRAKTPPAPPRGLEIESTADLDWIDRLKVALLGRITVRSTVRTEHAPGEVISDEHRVDVPLFRPRSR